jgi:DNA-binding winged helix-turn-helix (wHTH) protein
MTDHRHDRTSRCYRFGRFELVPAQRRLLDDGVAATIGARAFDVLVALVERRATVVSKDELLDSVWPGLVVEEANVQVQVSQLRKVIGADAVATVPRRGYQFVASIECDEVPAAAEPPSRGFLNSFGFLRTWRAAPATVLSRQTPMWIEEHEA